jgi:hypothetical protein
VAAAAVIVAVAAAATKAAAVVAAMTTGVDLSSPKVSNVYFPRGGRRFFVPNFRKLRGSTISSLCVFAALRENQIKIQATHDH